MRKTSSHFAKLILAAFILQVMLPFFATYSLPTKDQSNLAEISSIFGEKILLCTADGFKLVTLEDLQDGDVPAPHSDIKCPLCYVTVNGLNITAPDTEIATINILPHSTVAFSYDKDFPSTQYFHSKLKSRAPPVSLIV